MMDRKDSMDEKHHRMKNHHIETAIVLIHTGSVGMTILRSQMVSLGHFHSLRRSSSYIHSSLADHKAKDCLSLRKVKNDIEQQPR